MGTIKEEEEEMLRAIAARVLGSIHVIVKEGYVKAMEKYNAVSKIV
jgi:hypothetical protein